MGCKNRFELVFEKNVCCGLFLPCYPPSPVLPAFDGEANTNS